MGISRYWRLGLVLACLGIVALGCVDLAMARPGGGESYGGPSGGGSGGGGGGDGELIFFFLRLWLHFVFEYPLIGIPATIVLFVIITRMRKKNGDDLPWDSGSSSFSPPPPPPPPSRTADIFEITRLDENFSPVLFEDFAYGLFAKAHEARSSSSALDSLLPYLSSDARRHLETRPPAEGEVSGVVIGSMVAKSMELPTSPSPEAFVQVTLEFEANMTLTTGTAKQTHYVRERWRLLRRSDARSRSPESVRDFGCPSCGAPFEATSDHRCGHCGQVVVDGRFDWRVESINLLEIENRPPSLTGTVAERGTDWPTIHQPDVTHRLHELFDGDPQLTAEAFGHRFGLVFHDLNEAWTSRKLNLARPFLSDSLFEYLRYWVDAYRAQGLRNVLEDFRIERWTFVKITSDKYYDAITLRFWASGRDSTIREASGEVVAGNPGFDRAYSEYWTFIRGRGVKAPATVDRRCPNCGSPLEVNMAGVCSHCNSKINRGDFDWVLSKIEQDEAYSG